MSETVCGELYVQYEQSNETNENYQKNSKQPSVCEIVKLSHWFECARLLCLLFVRFCCFSNALCSHYYYYSGAFVSADHIRNAPTYNKEYNFHRLQRLRYDNTIELKFEI